MVGSYLELSFSLNGALFFCCSVVSKYKTRVPNLVTSYSAILFSGLGKFFCLVEVNSGKY